MRDYFPPTAATTDAEWTTEPAAEWRGPADDDELVRKMLASASRNAAAAFGGGGLAALWAGDVADGGRSEADQALANHLAFWTGRNCERMERLMRASGLVREKWDSPLHRDYLERTILKACGWTQQVLVAAADTPPPPPAEVVAAMALIEPDRMRTPGQEFMWPVQQLEHFDGCTFLTDQGLIFSRSRNALYSKTSFDVVYGGHMFIIDPEGGKKTDSAWDAFCKNRVTKCPQASTLCFRPELAPGAVVTEGSRTYANSYVPYVCPVAEGDPEPFLRLIAKMLPIETDRAILLAYLAAMAQYPGVKFQWWPVLQGVQGNGKTLILDAMTYIFGEQYTHLPNAHAMARDGMKFNSWIDRKLFIGVEEISLANKRDFLDEFKIIVTNRRIPMEGKGRDQTNGDNRANGILCTNHRDGVPVGADDRRYSILYTAQQCEADLIRDGMVGDYFPNLYNWLRGEGGNPHGAAIVAG